MPRPRVPPSQRRRAAEACSFCRETKKKCSGTAPCSYCLRRGIGSQCIITPRPRGSRSKTPTDAFTTTASLLADPRMGAECGSSEEAKRLESGASSFPSSDSRLSLGGGDSANPHPRMLLNSRGERGGFSVFKHSSVQFILTEINCFHQCTSEKRLRCLSYSLFVPSWQIRLGLPSSLIMIRARQCSRKSRPDQQETSPCHELPI